MTLTAVAALLFALASAVGVGFQVAMALGAPWGAYTMGGRFEGTLPGPMRLAAALQAGIIGVMAALILARAGLVLPSWGAASTWLIWIVVAFSGVSLVLNSVTPSRDERRVWAPITAILAASSLTVALTGG